VQLAQRLTEELQRKDEDLRHKDEDLRHKDEDLRRKDEQLSKVSAELRVSEALATEVRLKNLSRLQLSNVVELRGALEMCLKSAGLKGGGAATFAALLSTPPLGLSALSCCNQDIKVVSDNNDQPHSVDTLARALSQIMRRLNKDAHPKTSSAQYIQRAGRLLLARDGLSDSDVVILSCVLNAFGYPVEIVDDVFGGGVGSEKNVH
jgi:hypothetical protein